MRLMSDDVLLVVDVQQDFLPGGALAVPSGEEVVAPINRRPAHPGLASSQSCLVRDQSPRAAPFETLALSYGLQVLWPSHCVQGTAGAALAPGLELARAELVIRKGYHRGIDSYSAFLEADRRTPTGLAGYLRERGLRRLFLAGLATDFCVAWSAVDGCTAGFEVFVVDDACRGIDLEASLDRAWQNMMQAGVRRVASRELGA